MLLRAWLMIRSNIQHYSKDQNTKIYNKYILKCTLKICSDTVINYLTMLK